jgi:SAM-dependent methyltransferase
MCSATERISAGKRRDISRPPRNTLEDISRRGYPSPALSTAQDESGLKRFLSAAPIYQAFQNLVGAQRLYRRLVREHIRPAAGMRVLDIGCGPAEILGELAGDVTYLGFDLSEKYIAAARKRWGARGSFHCAPVNEMTVRELPQVDVVLAVGVLHHLDDGDAERVFKLAASALAPGGRVITYDPCFSPSQGALSRFLVSRDRGRHVRSPDGYEGLARRVFPHVAATLLDGHLRIPYTATVLSASRHPETLHRP